MRSWIDDYHEKTNLNAYPVALRTRGGIGYRKPNGEIESNFVGHPVHYYDGGIWKPITLQTHANGDFEGWVFAWRGNQILYKGFRLFEPKAVILDGKRHKLKFKQDGNIIRADLPFGEYRIIISETGVREELEIPSPIDGLIEFDIPHAGKPASLHKKNRHIVGGDFGESFLLTKSMTYPIIIDPDYVSDTADGVITGSNASFATARSTATSVNTPAITYFVGGFGYSGYQINRLLIKFLTAGIPDSDVISAATMTMHTNQVQCYTYNVDILIAKLDWSSNDPLTSGNMDTVYDACLTAALDNSIFYNSTTMVGNAFYTSGALDASWVSKTASTYYGMLVDRDRNNLTFGNYQAVEFHSANEIANPSFRPYLTITHAAPPPSAGFFHLMS